LTSSAASAVLKNEALEKFTWPRRRLRRSAQILLVSSVANAYLTLAADRENLTLAEKHAGDPAGCLQSDQAPP